ncbi:MAG TPA: TraR/DksA family transcriptional regulator, partial [Bacteroidaceae bacterium]|nr:TraR/DksA family transcriptional regulator [Bacteroidaceae bacterium]
MVKKSRYSDQELEEFRQIINEKLEVAQRNYDALKASLMNADNNSTDDTSPTYKVMEEGA